MTRGGGRRKGGGGTGGRRGGGVRGEGRRGAEGGGRKGRGGGGERVEGGWGGVAMGGGWVGGGVERGGRRVSSGGGSLGGSCDLYTKWRCVRLPQNRPYVVTVKNYGKPFSSFRVRPHLGVSADACSGPCSPDMDNLFRRTVPRTGTATARTGSRSTSSIVQRRAAERGVEPAGNRWAQGKDTTTGVARSSAVPSPSWPG